MKDYYLDYVEYFQNSTLKTNSPVIKWAKTWTTLHWQRYTDGESEHEKMSSLVIREMQIKLNNEIDLVNF